MSDLELSLDDIIKKNLKKVGPFRGRNNPGTMKKPLKKIIDPKSRVSKNYNVGTSLSNNSRMGNLRGKGGLQSAIGDARLRIIQKQRQKMTDAREKLGQIAKQTDARLKLVKLRERQRGNLSGGRLPTFVVEPQILQRTVQSRINDSYYDDELMDCTEDVSYFSRSSGDGGVISDDIYSYSYRTRQDKPVLYRTVENQMPPNRFIEPDKNVHSWVEPSLMSEHLTNIPTARTNPRNIQGLGRTDARGNGASWDLDSSPIIITKKVKPQETVGILKRSTYGDVYFGQTVKLIKESPPPNKTRGPTRTLSERFCQKGNASAQKISLLKAKLEASQKNNKNSPEVQQSMGYRIVVSNLVPSVTHEDVKELFEDIGELISSKVLRPGTAEVVYKLQKDAVKAVDVYHNRQLDGQPMKCLLVNNKSASPSSKLLKALDAKVGKTVVEVDMTAFRKALHKKSTS